MSREVNTQAMQEQLGFRIEPTGFDSGGYHIVFQGQDGKDSAVQPAYDWAWNLWEHVRALYLKLAEKDAEIAELRSKLGGSERSTKVHDDGTIEVRTKGERL